ncbi:MAG TPA: F0F1 ATP synthase subunit B [Planctomycetaceae bacterium]|jgi:F-type H+-transporting ATPase subunit b
MRSWLRGSLILVALAVALGATWQASPEALAAEQHEDSGVHDPLQGEASAQAPGPMTATSQDVDLAVWTLITFVVFVLVLKKLAWVPIIEGLDKRESSVFDNIAAAESSRIKAEKMLAEHAARLDKVQDEVREILAEAKRGAEHTKTEIIAAAQQEAEAARQRAVQDIDRARDQALDDLFGHMAKVVGEATEQVLGRTMTGADNERLIDEALSGFAQRKH